MRATIELESRTRKLQSQANCRSTLDFLLKLFSQQKRDLNAIAATGFRIPLDALKASVHMLGHSPFDAYKQHLFYFQNFDGIWLMQTRPISIQRHFTKHSPGSVLYRCGDTVVLCTASLSEQVPPWLEGKGRGWITAEYNMLPHSTSPRKARERNGKADGRTIEIQRLIGRSLRSIARLDLLGERSLTVDCDVLQADGGTRTASICGAFIAMVDALVQKFDPTVREHFPLVDSVGAISVGLINNEVMLDLNYDQDSAADVDMNIVMTGQGRFIEIQGTGEEATFDDEQLARLIAMARQGIQQVTAAQRDALGDLWPF